MTLNTKQLGPSKSYGALHVAVDIAQRYQLTALFPLIQSCLKLAEHNELSVALIGRFKAGKSSFLNSFLKAPHKKSY
jgi:predicted GTPase